MSEKDVKVGKIGFVRQVHFIPTHAICHNITAKYSEQAFVYTALE